METICSFFCTWLKYTSVSQTLWNIKIIWKTEILIHGSDSSEADSKVRELAFLGSFPGLLMLLYIATDQIFVICLRGGAVWEERKWMKERVRVRVCVCVSSLFISTRVPTHLGSKLPLSEVVPQLIWQGSGQ